MDPDKIIIKNEQVHHVLVVMERLREPVGLASVTAQTHPDGQVEPLNKRGAGLGGHMLTEDLAVFEVEFLCGMRLDQLQVFDAPAEVALDGLNVGVITISADL